MADSLSEETKLLARTFKLKYTAIQNITLLLETDVEKAPMGLKTALKLWRKKLQPSPKEVTAMMDVGVAEAELITHSENECMQKNKINFG